ncbi:hydroxyacylglutathione hydrolase [Methylophilus sp. OH31]|uniref:hydroxyacylglutathione hydrolase n=1 Tax=Methylophilus sp. OH31 TaxID=1387312 RepID=UPI0004667C21|nr:hydroxyacylglutathione hydrolase [Methylophilus sp. OH31]
MHVTSASIEITALPAFSDNYLWLIHCGQHALVVDPGDAEVVAQALQDRQLQLDGILLTHHHADHVGGAAALQQRWQCPVYAPDSDHPAYQSLQAKRVKQGDHLTFAHFGNLTGTDTLTCDVLALPGHTLDHVAYYLNHQHLFSGDVLFGAGCGRLFEGTPSQMYASLQHIAALPADTLIYPAHEYTAHNIAFAQTVDPDNTDLQQRAQNTANLRAQNLPTLPTTLALELATNPFLRCEALSKQAAFQHWSAIDVFTELRARRNHF